MKKLFSLFLCVVFLFQLTSCYLSDGYETTTENELSKLIGDVQSQCVLESGVPLKPYTISDGIKDKGEESFRPAYGRGICQEFMGESLVVLLFMDDDESSWSEQEIDSYTSNSVLPALGFLKREAGRWNVELDFQLESYSSATTDYTLQYFGVIPTRVSDDEDRDTLEQAAGDLGFASPWVLYSYMQSQYPSKNIIFITLFNKYGRSYTMQYARKSLTRSVEYCVIFAKTRPASTLAHEITHLFGAEDLYAENSSASTEEIAKREYPNDIMHTYLALEENCIDAYTAYAMGWTDEIPDVCYLDEWKIE